MDRPSKGPPAAADVSLREAADTLAHCRAPMVLIHRNPDGDCVGSATALATALAALGVRATIVCPDPLPEYLRAVPGAGGIVTSMEGREADLLVCLDVSDPSLLAPMPARLDGYLADRASLNIDHHLSNLRFAAANYVDTDAASTADIVQDLLSILGTSLTVEIATSLLYGIVNDTHSFQNSNTTPRTLRHAGELVEAGADLHAITYNLLLARRPAAARLWALVLPTLRLAEGDRVAFLTVSLEALALSGADLSDADGLVEFLRSIRGVALAVLCKQTGEHSYRLSLRTGDAIDATLIAGRFGGGGHRRAAGCETTGSLEGVQDRVLLAYAMARDRQSA